MDEGRPTIACLSCSRTESEGPLVRMRYRGAEGWLCVQCLPVAIHHPEQVAARFDEMVESSRKA